MAKGIRSSCAVALVLSQALWALPSSRPASAQALPPDFISPNVPHDVPSGSSATPQELALFAWQEFIALNWVAMDPGQTGVRGRPDPNVEFVDIAPTNGNFPLVVWQTYRHKNEVFPFGGPTDSQFDSHAPTYKYKVQPTPATGGQIPSFQLFNNLDEASQIGLANMYAYATSEVEPPATANVFDPTTMKSTPATPGPATGIRVAYEAKVNRAVFDYLVDPVKGYTKVVPVTKPGGSIMYTYPALTTALNNTVTINNNGLFGGICSFPSGVTPQPIVMLPCGDNAVSGDAGEGAIEIKAAWRKLTSPELTGGRFFTRNVLYYTGPQGNQRYNNEVWGLVALHIIHKTKSFPAFVFATWEQVDNYNDGAADPNTQNIAFQKSAAQGQRHYLDCQYPRDACSRHPPIHTRYQYRGSHRLQGPDHWESQYRLAVLQAGRCPGDARLRSAAHRRDTGRAQLLFSRQHHGRDQPDPAEFFR